MDSDELIAQVPTRHLARFIAWLNDSAGYAERTEVGLVAILLAKKLHDKLATRGFDIPGPGTARLKLYIEERA